MEKSDAILDRIEAEYEKQYLRFSNKTGSPVAGYFPATKPAVLAQRELDF